MGIDQIGKRSVPPPPSTDAAAGGRVETQRPFEMPAPGAPETSGAKPPAEALAPATSAIDRLRRGEIDRGGYVDLKVAEATRHLTALPAPQLEAIRQALRERISTDPTLADLVRAATAGAAEPPEEP